MAASLYLAVYEASFQMINVCIIQPVMKSYRLPFFIELSEKLANSGIRLHVVYSSPWTEEAKRGDHVQLKPPLGSHVKGWMIFRRLFVQPIFQPWIHADLVIVEHANKHALNWLLSVLQILALKRVAYWGHGCDRQGNPASIGERFKRHSLHWANWWFAYTTGAAKYVANEGYSVNKITVVENAIDTREFREHLDSISLSERNELLSILGWHETTRIAIYCGSLYTNKRLDLLMDAAVRVHDEHPEFRLLVLGGGPLAEEVVQFSIQHSWVSFVGPKFGREKALYFSLAEMALNPGLVGLGILDAFCAKIPLLTTDLPIHSPEIEYLVHKENGLILDPTGHSFAAGINALLTDSRLLKRLQDEAAAASLRYSINTMAENFANGVIKCLSR